MEPNYSAPINFNTISFKSESNCFEFYRNDTKLIKIPLDKLHLYIHGGAFDQSNLATIRKFVKESNLFGRMPDFILRDIDFKVNALRSEARTEISHTNETKHEDGIHTNEKGGKQTKLTVAFNLFPHHAAVKVANILHTGAAKYGVDNWKSIEVDDHLNHALYHINQYFITKDTNHLGNASCRILFALDITESKKNV